MISGGSSVKRAKCQVPSAKRKCYDKRILLIKRTAIFVRETVS